jgi:double-stranded uracil-DNA glycosylase
MEMSDKIRRVNQVIEEYFRNNPNQNKIQAKELMPQFIRVGIYKKDHSDGLPIRSLCRDLDDSDTLYLIPTLLVERKNKNRNWFFIRPNSNKPINKVKPKNNIVPSVTVKSQSAKENLLPDLIKPDLDIVFCGMAVGNRTAEVKLYYAGSGNKFYSILAETSLTDYELNPDQYEKLLGYNFGLTDLVKDTSGNDSDLIESDFDVPMFISKISEYKPKYVCFNGKAAASVFKYGNKNHTDKIDYGLMNKKINDVNLFVAPSTSGSAAGFWDSTYWYKLAELIKDKK